MTGQITVTTAKPLAGKKVFYFIQSIHAALGSNAILPAYRTDGSLTLGVLNIQTNKHNKGFYLIKQVPATKLS